MSISVTPNFVVDGQAILLSYNVRNNSNETVSDFRFFLASDTAVNRNDASSNTVDEDNVITMTDSGEGISLFAFSTTDGGVAVPTEYSRGNNSYWNKVYDGGDPSLTDRVASAGDSAFVTYFPLTTLAPGQSADYTLVVGMADRDQIGQINKTAKKALLRTGLDYEHECLKDLVPGATYIISSKDNSEVEYRVVARQDGTIPLAGTDADGKSYDFIGKSLSMYQKGEGDEADSDSMDVEVAARPELPDDPTVTVTPEVINSGDIHTTNDTITIRGIAGQEYKINDGQWYSPDGNGNVVFTNLEELTKYLVYTRVKATKDAPASATTDGVEVMTYGMFDPVVNDFDGEYDENAHKAIVETSVEGAKITYSLEENGTYREEPYSFEEPGTYNVYYKIQKENYYDAIGCITINVQKKTRTNGVQISDAKVYSSRAVVSEITPKTNDVLYAVSTRNIPPVDEDEWQTSNVFDGLQPNTTYYIFAKNQETKYYTESVSNSLRIRTSEAVDVKKLKVVNGTPKVVAEDDDVSIQITGRINDTEKVDEIYLKLRKVGEKDWLEIPMYDVTTVESEFTSDIKVGGNGLEYDSIYEYQYVVKATIDGEEKEIPSDIIKIQTPKKATEEKKIEKGKIVSAISNTTDSNKIYTVSIEKGNTVIQSQSIYVASGETSEIDNFEDVPAGIYNLVIRDVDGEYVETRIIEVKPNKTSDITIETVAGSIQSKVNIIGNTTENVAVSGLHKIITDADKASALDGSKGVEVKLDVEEKNVDNAVGIEDILNVVEDVNQSANITMKKEVKQVLDLSLFKISKDYVAGEEVNSETTDIGDKNDVVLEIVIPYDGEYNNIGIVRYHVDEATMLIPLANRPEDDFEDGTFYVGEDNIYIYARKFSTYAIIADSDERVDVDDATVNTGDYELGNGGAGIIDVTSDTVVPGYVFQQNITYIGRRVDPPKTGENNSSNSESNARMIIDIWLSDDEDEEDGENE